LQAGAGKRRIRAARRSPAKSRFLEPTQAAHVFFSFSSEEKENSSFSKKEAKKPFSLSQP
jgi:hypothetical protein